MQISHGLLAGQVLQRDANNTGHARIRGTCAAAGPLEWRVRQQGQTLAGHDWTVAGTADGTAFNGELTGVPTGGPYDIELRIRSGETAVGQLTVAEIFVGDVWILGGQSNMEGIGNLADAPAPHPLVRAFYMRDEWAQAREKLHVLQEAVDRFHNGYGDGPGRPSDQELAAIRKNLVKGVGPGLAFGLVMRERSGVPQGLIPCAHGGTSMAQWSPALRDQGGASLYGAMMRRYEKLGQPVAGLLWYQGESDANEACAAVYTEKMMELVAATRRDMKLPELPWFVVQIGCHVAAGDGQYWNSIQEQQRRLPEKIDHLGVVPALDLGLDDGIHISGKDQRVLGRRLALLADSMVYKSTAVPPGIALDGIKLVPTPDTPPGSGARSVEITYRHVVGQLTSSGRPTGFSLLDAHGEEVPGIYKTTLRGNRVLLHAQMPEILLETLALSYGHGRYPYCNITDRDATGLPGMQAVPLVPDHARQCLNWETARMPEAPDLQELDSAAASASLDWQPAPPREGFGFLPKAATDKRTGMFLMRTELRTAEALQAHLFFGTNIPFKIWLNDKIVLADFQACPPLNPERYRVEMALAAGTNRLLVGLALARPEPHLGIVACVGTRQRTAEPRLDCYTALA